MEALIEQSLATMLSASLSTSGLGPVIDAQKASVMLGCSQEHIERLAEGGQLPGKKYGRGWIFITAQLLHHVVVECAGNLRAIEASPGEPTPAAPHSVADLKHARTPSPLALEPLGTPKRRGRPRRPLLDPH